MSRINIDLILNLPFVNAMVRFFCLETHALGQLKKETGETLFYGD
jgi:hypothetical protein